LLYSSLNAQCRLSLIPTARWSLAVAFYYADLTYLTLLGACSRWGLLPDFILEQAMLIEYKIEPYFSIQADFLLDGPDEGKVSLVIEDVRIRDRKFQNTLSLWRYNEAVDFVKNNDHLYVINQLFTMFGGK
jgi:hypothetical protein